VFHVIKPQMYSWLINFMDDTTLSPGMQKAYDKHAEILLDDLDIENDEEWIGGTD